MRQTILISIGVAVPAFVAAPLLFPVSADAPQITGGQMALFVVLAAVEALALGLAVAIALRAPAVIRRLPASQRGPARVAAVATVWFLGNWWVHDGLHMTSGLDISRLLIIEYAFHVTLIVAAGALAAALVRLGELRFAATSASQSIDGGPVATV